jgi:hypothetical protein
MQHTHKHKLSTSALAPAAMQHTQTIIIDIIGPLRTTHAKAKAQLLRTMWCGYGVRQCCHALCCGNRCDHAATCCAVVTDTIDVVTDTTDVVTDTIDVAMLPRTVLW